MQDSQVRVVEEHAWSGRAHDLADLFSYKRFVTMRGALGAGRFTCPKGIALDALDGVFRQGLTVSANPVNRSGVMCAAEEGNHFPYRLALTVEPFIF
jgi:hypothetical protein